MSAIIEVKNLGKKYSIGEKEKYLAMRDILTNIARAPFSWLKAKTYHGPNANDFWALQDINFTVEQGEVLGIMGRNGAGKSTLLKILSRITPPTTGEIRLRGRVGSLLEVGTGFHPELTGRENIYLNGAILGMRKKEIERKFDEIVDFSGVEKFLDTPVKRYSSGMYVRLAFSVAAHLEPDILIVDEVLAVGDAEFQKKCLGKMQDVSSKDGRTVLFVSHNIGALKNLCKRSLLLQDGKIIKEGPTIEVADFYLNKNQTHNAVVDYPVQKGKPVNIRKISLLTKEGTPSFRIPINERFSVKIEYEFFETLKNAMLSVVFNSGDDMLLYSSESDTKGAVNNYEVGIYTTVVEVPAFLFNIGNFHFSAVVHNSTINFEAKHNINFEIIDTDNVRSLFKTNYLLGKIAVPLEYNTIRI